MVAVKALAERRERTHVRWREGRKGWLEAEFAWVRVWVGHRWERGVPAEAIPDPDEPARWLLVEWRKDGTTKYALSNLPPETTLEQAAPGCKERRQVERGYLQLKDELGLDHFEGRSWNGSAAAIPPPAAGRSRRRGSGPRRVTLPGVRRSLQRLSDPPCRLPCPACRDYRSGEM